MNQAALMHSTTPERLVDEDRIRWLIESVRSNRFLPQPDSVDVFVGDGDFRAIGAEFLGHFIRIGGLRQDSRVLDIGCGIGRMAVPLTQYLDPRAGRYDGIDPVDDGINWCQRAITPVYLNFAFHRLDIAHELYNPNGKISGKALELPFPDRHFDFVIMTSIVTHLPPAEILVYLAEVRRVLMPGGRLFLTAFVVDPIAAANETGRRDPRLAFRRYGKSPCWFVPSQPPLAAVGFEDGFLDMALARAGLALVLKSLGHWRGTNAGHHQDFIVAKRRGDGR
ncbi:class I SAM-dependent methyltransferase [Rhizobiaceae bacterium n13]|uniref:class I SAM-dependent methyltransferase n=1 Tax=Ferirhizobium litorale TaxID=2927786 RepID=UPI0024B2F744|nr:class I SAM-dependent methyltransferase [Fererhizobium litorale]MDI7865240.1 class I SAM-dependent methyltransferase [Fererhizobium litorale]